MTPLKFWIIAVIEVGVVAGNGDEQKFKKMCQAYLTRKPKQYAVFWIGDNDYSGKANTADFVTNGINKGDYFIASRFHKDNQADAATGTAATSSGQEKGLSDEGPSKKKKKQTGNAVPVEKKKHDEDVILDNALPLIEKYSRENSDQKPDLYLYSRNSPCCGSQPTSKKLTH